MLKGKTIIELTDINTGNVETYEDTNMVTNALNELFCIPGKTEKTLYTSIMPMYQKALGGLLLFDTQIEEDVNNLLPPSNANMIGCAKYNVHNTSTLLEMGSYNETESLFDEANKTMKYVYDFSTSQANGIIESVCLTSSYAGRCPYGQKNSTISFSDGIRLSIGTVSTSFNKETGESRSYCDYDKYGSDDVSIDTDRPFLIDFENDIVYYFKIKSTNQISIIKKKANLKSVSIMSSPYNTFEVIETKDINLSEQIYEDDKKSVVGYNYDSNDNCLYIYPRIGTTYNSVNVKANEAFKIYKIDIDTFNLTEIIMTNTCGKELTYTYFGYAICHKGFFYIPDTTLGESNDKKGFVSFEIGASTNCKIILANGNEWPFSPPIPVFCENGRIFYTSNSASNYSCGPCFVVNENSEEYYQVATNYIFSGYNYKFSGTMIPVKGHKLIMHHSGFIYPGFEIFAGYLATINNLSTPVEKTSTKTMKITYVIQEV